MKQLGIGLLVLGTVICSAMPAEAQKKGKVNGGKYGWMTSLAGGRELARKTGKPLMVVIRCVP